MLYNLSEKLIQPSPTPEHTLPLSEIQSKSLLNLHNNESATAQTQVTSAHCCITLPDNLILLKVSS